MDTITYKILALQFNRPLALELPLKEYGTAFLQLSPFEKLEAIFKDNDFLIRFPQTGNSQISLHTIIAEFWRENPPAHEKKVVQESLLRFIYSQFHRVNTETFSLVQVTSILTSLPPLIKCLNSITPPPRNALGLAISLDKQERLKRIINACVLFEDFTVYTNQELYILPNAILTPMVSQENLHRGLLDAYSLEFKLKKDVLRNMFKETFEAGSSVHALFSESLPKEELVLALTPSDILRERCLLQFNQILDIDSDNNHTALEAENSFVILLLKEIKIMSQALLKRPQEGEEPRFHERIKLILNTIEDLIPVLDIDVHSRTQQDVRCIEDQYMNLSNLTLVFVDRSVLKDNLCRVVLDLSKSIPCPALTDKRDEGSGAETHPTLLQIQEQFEPVFHIALAMAEQHNAETEAIVQARIQDVASFHHDVHKGLNQRLQAVNIKRPFSLLDESTPLTPTYYRAFGFAYSGFMECIQPFLE